MPLSAFQNSFGKEGQNLSLEHCNSFHKISVQEIFNTLKKSGTSPPATSFQLCTSVAIQ